MCVCSYTMISLAARKQLLFVQFLPFIISGIELNCLDLGTSTFTHWAMQMTINLKKKIKRTGEVAWCLRALGATPENLALIPSTHTMAHIVCNSGSYGPVASSGLQRHQARGYRHKRKQGTRTHKNRYIFKFKVSPKIQGSPLAVRPWKVKKHVPWFWYTRTE